MSPAEIEARSLPLNPKIVEEVRELHERNRALAQDRPRGRAGRRERKDARHAEDDLLRVLGFTTYDEFELALERARRVAAPDAGGAPPDPERDDAAPDAGPDAAHAIAVAHDDVDLSVAPGPVIHAEEARRTEAALLRVLRDDDLATGRPPSGTGTELDVLRDRVAAVEEELAETRFELAQMRNAIAEGPRGAAPVPEPAGPADLAPVRELAAVVTDLTNGLAQTVGELRGLCETLRAERSELHGLAGLARVEAEQVLARARADAQRMRDDATAEAARCVEDARAQAGALMRDAMVTRDGLRRLASEDETDPRR